MTATDVTTTKVTAVDAAASDPGVDAFRAECLAFLDANAAPKPVEVKDFVWGEGDDGIELFHSLDPATTEAELAEAKGWLAKRFDAGLGWITGPRQYGGRGLPVEFAHLYQDLESRYEVPNQGYFSIGLGMVVHAILHHARDHVRERYLPALHRGDVVACQLFSEPGAGSDLAGLQTRAERDGDEWVITGQKVWTSFAHCSDIGEVVCRTDRSQPKHKGLTAFVVDMKAPGVDVRPLRQMNGGASFNEVFLNEVRVPDDHRLGEVDDGWTVVMTTLMNERAGAPTRLGSTLDKVDLTMLTEMLRHFGLENDRLLRNELVDVYVHAKVAGYTSRRLAAAVKPGQVPGPEMSMSKLASSQTLNRAAQFIARVLGPRLTADTGEWGTYKWNQLLLSVPGLRIAAGTDEILRTILGERVLGLPKEPAADRGVPFQDLAAGRTRPAGGDR